MYWQTRQAQQLHSANSILTLRERFDAPRMREARRRLSGQLLRGEHEDITSVEVATFFELMGALTHKRVLSEAFVWEAFGTWITTYYSALRRPVDLIGRTRTELRDPLVFHEFEWLTQRMLAMDRKEMGAIHAARDEQPDDNLVILRREADLQVA